MKKKYIFWAVGIVITVLVLAYCYLYALFWEGNRYLGELKHPCSQYSIKIFHYAEFEPVQLLYFSIVKNGKLLDQYGGQFEITNNKLERLSSFEIHCHNDVLYVTWREGNIPVIMFDTKTEELFFNNSDYENVAIGIKLFNKIRTEKSNIEWGYEDMYNVAIGIKLFNKIRTEKSNIEWGYEDMYINNLISPCNKDYEINMYYDSVYYSFGIWRTDTLIITDTLSITETLIADYIITDTLTTDTLIEKNLIFTETLDLRYEDVKSGYFDIHCCDSILYVTDTADNIPIIIFDTQSEELFYKNGENKNDSLKELFEKIRIER